MTAIDTDFMIDTATPIGLIKRALRACRAIFTISDDHIDTAERRAFVQEMIARNPDAFSSDYDVHSMMQHFPGHF
ncbi:MAG: hypothetical protein ACJAVT_001289 [Yoonia sp.]|jgi:hypothetical protein